MADEHRFLDLKRGFTDDETATIPVTQPQPQPNIMAVSSQEVVEKSEFDPATFYTSGWFAKVRPYYRRLRVNYEEVNKSLDIDWNNAAKVMGQTDLRLVLCVVNCMSRASLFYDTDPGLVEEIFSKAAETAIFDPIGFHKVCRIVFPWIFGNEVIPTFDDEKGMRTLFYNNTPVDFYVYIHTIRLYHDREPLKSLNIDMDRVISAENRLSTFGDLRSYYDFVKRSGPEYQDSPPRYMVEYMAGEGVDIDF